MKTCTVTLLSEFNNDKHLSQVSKILVEVGKLFDTSINIKTEDNHFSGGSIRNFQRIIHSCQSSDAAILAMESEENSSTENLRNELGVITRYAESGNTCALFEPQLVKENAANGKKQNAVAYLNASALLFDHIKISEAAILLQKAKQAIIENQGDADNYDQSIIQFVQERVSATTTLSEKNQEYDAEALLSWGGLAEA